MFKQEMKIFRDSVHGYIKIPVDYVSNFIDTELFQRLRGIEQTGMRTLYPSARHDRFIHSLGTFFIGHKAITCFRENVRMSYDGTTAGRGDHYNVCPSGDTELFWDRCQFLFEIACLLHDCGHAPFSHTLEFHYDAELVNEPLDLKDKLKEYLGSKGFQKDFQGEGSPHERMSALLVCSEYRQNIEHLVDKYGLKATDDGDPIEFVARMIIGCKYGHQSHINQIKNCFIDLLNSKSIDVDKLDYIIRDAKLSGIDNMSIDIERLLNSLTLVETTDFTNCRLRNRQIAANIIEGSLKQNGHLAKLSGKCRGTFEASEKCSGNLSGMLDIWGFFKTLNESSISSGTDTGALISINGTNYSNKIPCAPHASIKLCGILDNPLSVEGVKLSFGKQMNGHVELQSEEFRLSSTYVDANLDGVFSGTLLGNFESITGGQVKCTLGFHKSSLSVIQNVVLARNYEYQWIYSHHKVVYYANFLIIDLVRNCVDFLLKQQAKKDGSGVPVESASDVIGQMLSWKTMINHSGTTKVRQPYILDGQHFYRPSDADLMTLFQKCRMIAPQDSALGYQLQEYFSRRYKKSLWKSYAEFCIFFSDFADVEREQIFCKIQENSSYSLYNQYGYFNESWKKALNGFGLKNVVWVNGDSSLKTLDPQKTYVLFKNCTLTYETVSTANDIQSVGSLNLFYIYYDTDQANEPIDQEGLVEFIRSQL